MKDVRDMEREAARLGALTAEERAAADLQLFVYRLSIGLEAEHRGMLDVIAERLRQVEAEGWTPEHDDQHTEGELADAAACYAAGSIPFVEMGPKSGRYVSLWPWAREWWKPATRRRRLIKAGALILAEIERLDRIG